MMLGMLHVDPLQLLSFLDTAETSLKLVNTILREPARTDAEFRKKLGGLFRELHGIKARPRRSTSRASPAACTRSKTACQTARKSPSCRATTSCRWS